MGMPLSMTCAGTGACTSFWQAPQAHLPRTLALDAEDAGLVVQPLGDILADALHLAAAGAGRVLRLVVHIAARQVRRQRLAPGRVLGLLFLVVGLVVGSLLELGGQLRDVAVQRLFKQALLFGAYAGAELLAGDGVLQPPQDGDFVRELIDRRLLEGDFAALAGQQLIRGQGPLSELSGN